MKRCSLRTMIAVFFALIVLAVIFLISAASEILISRQFEKYIGQQQYKKAEEMAVNLTHQYDNAAGEWNLDYIHGIGMYALSEGYIIKLYDAEEKVLWDAENHDMTLCSQMMDAISLRMQEERPELNGDFVTHRFDLRWAGGIVGFLDVSYYSPYYLNETDFQFIAALNRILLGVGTVSLLGAVLLGRILAGSIAKPITETAEITERISEGDYSIRFTGKVRSRELAGLAGAVNRMAASLEEQENLRRRLTSDVAHELRTPIANVTSYLEALLEGVWEPTPDRLRNCYEELERISGLVADLEQLQQVENGNLQLHKTKEDLWELVQSVVRSFEQPLAEKQLHCTVEGGHPVVSVDRGRIQQVVTNLLSNAIKYSNEGGRIRLLLEETEDAGLLRVEDEGVGIAEADLKRIFERFYRTDKSRSRQTGGAGIGLTIVKAIVRAHSGQISVESKPGQGSTFTVWLPKEQ
ncbi:MAG: sensor histidine kinase [Eubacteriales bacterium]